MKPSSTLIAALLLMNFICYSQLDTIDVKRSEKGVINFVRFDSKKILPKLNDTQKILSQLLSPPKNIEFKLIRTEEDGLGYMHQLYNIYNNGIKVEGIGYAVHSKGGSIVSMGGNYTSIPVFDSIGIIAPATGLQNALNILKGKKYIWEDQLFENEKKRTLNDNTATYFPKGELIIADFSYDEKVEQYSLCYKYEITSFEPFSSEDVYVDAKTGAIIEKISKIKSSNDVQGTAQTRYSGTQTIWTNTYDGSYGPGYNLYEFNTSGRQIFTYNLNHSASGTVSRFLDNDNNWTSAEYNNANKDNIALDIHWASEKCFDYFKTTFNRNGYNNNTTLGYISNYFHYGTNTVGAFYSRYSTSDLAGSILCGDGDATHNPYGTLDVYAHEYGHAFWDFTVGYASNQHINKEQGALDEGFADIWATIIEAWAAPGKQRWIQGEEIIAGGERNSINPNSFHMPDTYQGLYYVNTTGCTPTAGNDYCGNHTNMGIVGVFFNLLCDGGNGVNDLANPYAVTGIGIDKAAQIVYRSESFYMHYLPNLNVAFSGTRDAMVNAATDLYGASSCEVLAVKNAWYAVGIGANPITSGSYLVTGNSPICTSQLYSLSGGLPAGATSLSWTATPSGIVNFSSLTSNPTTVNKITNGTVSIFAAYKTSTGCIVGTSSAKLNVAIGLPKQPSFLNYVVDPIVTCNEVQVSTEVVSGVTYTWSYYKMPYTNNLVQFPNSPNPKKLTLTQGTGSYNLGVTFTNTCGTGPIRSVITGTITCSGGGQFAMSPNPASSTVTIQPDTDNSDPKTAQENAKLEIQSIDLFDQSGNLKKQWKYSVGNKQAILNLSGLQPGIYFVEVFDGSARERKKLIIGNN